MSPSGRSTTRLTRWSSNFCPQGLLLSALIARDGLGSAEVPGTQGCRRTRNSKAGVVGTACDGVSEAATLPGRHSRLGPMPQASLALAMVARFCGVKHKVQVERAAPTRGRRRIDPGPGEEARSPQCAQKGPESHIAADPSTYSVPERMYVLYLYARKGGGKWFWNGAVGGTAQVFLGIGPDQELGCHRDGRLLFRAGRRRPGLACHFAGPLFVKGPAIGSAPTGYP